jgi:hypothetical protein
MESSYRKAAGWQRATIDAEKLRIKAELDEVGLKDGQSARLRHALDQVFYLMNETDLPHAQMRCYIFIVSALIHHVRQGGLNSNQVTRLVSLANAILRTQGIKPASSKLGFLYGELHLALSQVYRRDGAQWKAAWEHEVALYLSQRSAKSGFLSLTLGICASRLGHTGLAVGHFKRAEGIGLDARYHARTRLEWIKALRLAGDLDGSSKLAAETQTELGLTASEKLEVEWEGLCRQAQQTGELKPIISSVLKGRPHHSAMYIIEAFLWSRVVKSREWIVRFPTVRSLSRGTKIKSREAGYVFECAKALEECYDFDIPYLYRLETLGNVLASTEQLFNLDLELLVWAAAARWLARSRSHALTLLVVREYQAKSLRITEGRKKDALGLVQDLHYSEESELAEAA